MATIILIAVLFSFWYFFYAVFLPFSLYTTLEHSRNSNPQLHSQIISLLVTYDLPIYVKFTAFDFIKPLIFSFGNLFLYIKFFKQRSLKIFVCLILSIVFLLLTISDTLIYIFKAYLFFSIPVLIILLLIVLPLDRAKAVVDRAENKSETIVETIADGSSYAVKSTVHQIRRDKKIILLALVLIGLIIGIVGYIVYDLYILLGGY